MLETNFNFTIIHMIKNAMYLTQAVLLYFYNTVVLTDTFQHDFSENERYIVLN